MSFCWFLAFANSSRPTGIYVELFQQNALRSWLGVNYKVHFKGSNLVSLVETNGQDAVEIDFVLLAKFVKLGFFDRLFSELRFVAVVVTFLYFDLSFVHVQFGLYLFAIKCSGDYSFRR